jgi:tetratricopeptide (TPR) repeat protein
VLVYLVPAFIFLTSYRSTWVRAGTSEAKPSATWRGLSIAAVGGLVAALLLILTRPDRDGRVNLEGLEKISTLNPASSTARLNLAFNLEKEGRLDEALASYRRALELQSDLVPARFGEGNVLFSKGAYKDAARSFEDVLRHRPEDRMARYNLGTAYLDLGRFDLAKTNYQEVLRSNPDDPAALKNLGQALIGLNQRCEALVPLERSTVLDARLTTDATIGEQLRILRAECGPR